jgi:hypothetical protein
VYCCICHKGSYLIATNNYGALLRSSPLAIFSIFVLPTNPVVRVKLQFAPHNLYFFDICLILASYCAAHTCRANLGEHINSSCHQLCLPWQSLHNDNKSSIGQFMLKMLFAHCHIGVVLAIMPVGLLFCQEFPCAIRASEGSRLIFRHARANQWSKMLIYSYNQLFY